MQTLTVIQRRNQRLNQTYRAIEGARVAPSLQIVGLIDVPVAMLGGFVLIQAMMNAKRNTFEGLGKIQVDGRIEERIHAGENQQLHLACGHVRNEVLE